MRQIDLNNFQVATSETARDINRRIVLNLIRNHQPISRADLARHSGLQRSTVSVITEQLIGERWVTEGANGHLPRGRRPRFLHLNKERVGIIGINIRPETSTLALANLDAQFVAQETFPTAAQPEQFLAEVLPRLRNLMALRPEISYEGVGISLPGRVDLDSQQLVFAPNLGWSQFDLKTPLEQATGLPVELENAANACALAEVWFGQHKIGGRNLLAVTVSEGVGCGLILNHELVRGSNGATGEFGHVTLVENGFPCRCGNHGCWEIYASNAALVRYYVAASAPARQSKKAASGLEVKEPKPSVEEVFRLAEYGDPKALAAVQQVAHHLGIGLAMLVTGLAPDVIVVIGEITRLWGQIQPIIEARIRERSFTHAATRILPTDPATQPRLRGTIALVLQKHFGAPLFA